MVSSDEGAVGYADWGRETLSLRHSFAVLPHQREAFFRTPVTPSVIARRPIGPTSKELLERSDLEFGVAQLAISAPLGCQMLWHVALSNS